MDATGTTSTITNTTGSGSGHVQISNKTPGLIELVQATQMNLNRPSHPGRCSICNMLLVEIQLEEMCMVPD
jgi:hypothetical protein